MKRLILFLVLLPSMNLMAEENEEKYRSKLKKEFVSAIPWVQDFSAATRRAQSAEKLIFGYFTRSYAP